MKSAVTSLLLICLLLPFMPGFGDGFAKVDLQQYNCNFDLTSFTHDDNFGLENRSSFDIEQREKADIGLVMPRALQLNVVSMAGPAASSSSFSFSIKGVILDATTGEALPGANVMIMGTSLGAASNLDGKYIIKSVPPGSYTLRVKYIGYKDFEQEINLARGKTLVQNVEMHASTLTGEEVVVTAQAEGQMEAINQQLSARTISNIVASDRIQEVPDANAGESVGRLPGVSLLRSAGEGNKVTIRGLSPQYNAISINGTRMTSTSSGSNADRSVDLNMISSEMLAGIEVIKAPTADKDADVLGGTVDFKLIQAPKGLHSNVSVQGGYNSQQNQYNMYKVVGNVSNRFWNDKFGVFVQGNYDKTNRGSDNLSSSWEVDEVNNTAGLNSLVLNDRREDRFRYGGSLLFDYKLPDGIITFNTFFSRLKRKVLNRKNSFSSSANVTTSINKTETNTDVLSSALYAENDFGLLTLDGSVSYMRSQSKKPYDKGLTFAQSTALDLSQTTFYDLRPEEINALYHFDANRSAWSGTGGNVSWSDVIEDELATTINATLPLSFFDGAVSTKIILGGKIRNKTRSQDAEQLTMHDGVVNPGSTPFRQWIIDHYPEYISSDIDDRSMEGNAVKIAGLLDKDYDTGEFLGGDYELGPAILEQALDDISQVYYHFDQKHASNSERNDHSGSEDTYAGYIMAEINVGADLKFIPGVRYEHFESEYTAARSIQGFSSAFISDSYDTTTTRKNYHFFPMIHLKYQPLEWFDIRAAYTHTLTRPSYSSFVPRIYSNLTSCAAGNIYLKPALAENVDLYFSFHSNYLGLFSFGGFYKEIDDLVWNFNAGLTKAFFEKTLNDFQIPFDFITERSKFASSINNPYTAYVRGFEVDFQTNFWYLPTPFNGIVLNANYSKISSDTKYVRYLSMVDYSTFPFTETTVDTFRTGRMIHQPNDIWNISVGYDFGGFSSRLSFLFQGNTLTGLAGHPLGDGFSEDYFRMDLKVMQKLPVEGLQLYLNVNNLTDTPGKSTQAAVGYLKSAAYYGITGDIGLRYRF